MDSIRLSSTVTFIRQATTRVPETQAEVPYVIIKRLLGLSIALIVANPSAEAVERGSQQVAHFMGSFSHGLPIQVPPFHGIEPRLGFAYSSEGGNGLLGVGWGLAGFSELQRVSVGFQKDGTPLLQNHGTPPCSLLA